MSEAKVPYVGDLLKDCPSNWGRWGKDDEVGALNYLDAEQVIAATRLVRKGKVFTLQVPMGDPAGDPVWPSRRSAERYQVLDEGHFNCGKGPVFPGGLHYADDVMSAYLQGSTQYDALGHVWYDGKLYNGYDAMSTVGGLSKVSVQRSTKERPSITKTFWKRQRNKGWSSASGPYWSLEPDLSKRSKFWEKKSSIEIF